MKFTPALVIVMLLVPSFALAEDRTLSTDVKIYSAAVAVGAGLASVEANIRAEGQARALSAAQALPRRVDVMIHFEGSAAQAQAAELRRLDEQFRRQMGTVVELRQRAGAIEESLAIFRGDEAARAEWQRLRNLAMLEAGEAGGTVLRQMDVQAGAPVARLSGTVQMPNADVGRVIETAADLKKGGAETIRVVSAPSAAQEFEKSLIKSKGEGLESRASQLRGVALVGLATAALGAIVDYVFEDVDFGFGTRVSGRTEKPAAREMASVPANVQTPKSFIAGAGR